MPEKTTESVVIRPVGKVRKAPGFFDNPIVQDLIEGLLIPLVKNGIQMVVERLLFGDQGTQDPYPRSGRVSYGDHFARRQAVGPRFGSTDRHRQYQRVRSQFPQLDDLVFRNEEDATLVINAMYDRIESYTFASVADLYDIVQLDVPDYTYTKFGWNQAQLSQYELRNHPAGGVRLVMPRPYPLES